MKIFRKLFGDPSKNAPGANVGQWDALLSKCDLLMVRDEIELMHRMLIAQGEKEGGDYYFKNEYVGAWEAFRDNPNIETARDLLDVAPGALLKYFEMCSSGSQSRGPVRGACNALLLYFQMCPPGSSFDLRRERQPIFDLASAIATAAMSCGQAMKPHVHFDSEEKTTEAWIYVCFEFMYFFVHMTDRYAFAQLGQGTNAFGDRVTG